MGERCLQAPPRQWYLLDPASQVGFQQQPERKRLHCMQRQAARRRHNRDCQEKGLKPWPLLPILWPYLGRPLRASHNQSQRVVNSNRQDGRQLVVEGCFHRKTRHVLSRDQGGLLSADGLRQMRLLVIQAYRLLY